MSELKLVVPGTTFQTELSTSQIPIAVGAGTFAVVNNLATITFAAAHGLTLTPAAGIMPNYFIQFNGVTAQTGVGNLNGPIFRILSIPSTTTIVIYTTVTAATVTAANAVPVFIPVLAPIVGSAFAGGPLMTGVTAPGLLGASAAVNMALGPNCTVQYNPDNTSIIEDASTGNTLAVAPVFRTLVGVSLGAQVWMDAAGGMAVFASGGAGTSRFSVIA